MSYDRRATPVHKSLLEHKTIAGVDSKMAIMNGTIATAITMGLQTFYMIPIAMLIHMFLKWLTKKDPQIIKIYGQYRIYADVYDPWPRNKVKTNARPKGFAKGLLC